MIESIHAGLNPVLFPHFEVLPEVLVSAPPISPDHGNFLVPSHLMEVRVSDIILLVVGGHSPVSVHHTLRL